MNSISSQRRELFSFAIILAAVILLFWWRVWTPSAADRMHFTDDILIKDYPTRLGLFRLLLQGHMPLWDPYQFGGWPGIANCEAGFFYPFNWLLIPFVNSPEIAFQVTQWLVLLHFLIAGLGAYRLSRTIGLSPIGASMAAVAYTFCGFHCAHKKHTNMFFSLVWLPWILLQAEFWIREKRPFALPAMAALLALAYMAGHPQASLYITLVVSARLIHAAVADKPSGRVSLPGLIQRGFPLFWVVGAAFALSAVQWLPLWELIQESERSGADMFQRSTEFSLPPLELIDAMFPEALQGWSHVEVFYWGGIPLLLMFLTLFKSALDSFQRFLLLLAILSILLALGEYVFVYDLSYVLVPGIAWVRAPSRWIYFASLPIAILAGKGIDLLLRSHSELAQENDPTFARMGLAWFGIMGLICLCIMPNVEAEVRLQIVQALLYQVLFSGTFLLGLFLYQFRRISPQGTAMLAIALTWLDLGTHYRTLDLQPGFGGYGEAEAVDTIHDAAFSQRTKVFLGAGGVRDQFHGAAQGFRELDGQSPLTPRLHLELREDTAIPFPDKPNTALLNLLGVGTILTDHKALAKPFVPDEEPLYVHDTIPSRARVYRELFPVEPDTQREILKLQSFPYDRVLLSTPHEIGEESEEKLKQLKITAPQEDWPLFSKPFLLASGSIYAVSPTAMLVVDGRNHFADLPEEPGYFFAVADNESGEIEETASFNLMNSIQDPEHPAHEEMREFVEEIPAGKTVFVAVRDNAANVLLAEGVGVLRAIGASVDMRKGFRMAHAIIGRKGAPIGSALEIFSATEALALQTGKSVTVEGVAAAKPSVNYLFGTKDAAEWYKLLSLLNEIPPKPVVFDTSSEITKDPRYPAMNVAVYSVPKKSGENAVLQPTEDKASILINGVEESPNKVGYNLVAVDPLTQSVVMKDSFNLMNDMVLDATTQQYRVADPPLENQRMQAFIHSVTEGLVVMGAIRDDGTDLIQQDTIDALRLVGSAIVIDITNGLERKRISHAFIGVKGATQCVEAFWRERDAIVFSRYPGGPVLMPEDMKNPSDLLESINPLDEIIAEASDTSWNRHTEPAATWAVQDEGPNRIVATGMSPSGGTLFINELYYPGWHASIDGLPVSVDRVNYYFRSIQVPAGLHTVVMEYQPDGFYIGLYVSLGALLGCFMWIVWIRLHLNPGRKV